MKFSSRIISNTAILLCLFTSSCDKFSFEITQRKYRPGFHVDFSNAKTKAAPQKKDLTATKQELKKPKAIELTSQSQEISNNYPERKESAINTESNIKDTKSHDAGKTVAPGERTKPTSEFHPKAVQKNSSTQSEKNKSKNTRAFYWLAGIGGLLSAGIFMSIRKKAIQMSQWSSQNINFSRGIQVLGHSVLGLGSFIAGIILYKHDIVATPVASAIFTSVFLGTTALHPMRKRGQVIFQSNYNKTKLTGLTLVVSSIMMCSSLGNQVAQGNLTVSTGHLISIEPAQHLLSEISAEANQLDRVLLNSDTPSSKEKLSIGQIILLILIPIVFAFLTAFTIALSCGIMCQGNEGLAAVVLIGGLALVILLSILATKGVMKMPRRKAFANTDKK